jgi:uncharacterized protein (DUF3084 family)
MTEKKAKKAKKPSVQVQLKSALNVIQEQASAMASMEKELHRKAHEIGALRQHLAMYESALDARDQVVVKLDARVVSLIGSVERLTQRR